MNTTIHTMTARNWADQPITFGWWVCRCSRGTEVVRVKYDAVLGVLRMRGARSTNWCAVPPVGCRWLGPYAFEDMANVDVQVPDVIDHVNAEELLKLKPGSVLNLESVMKDTGVTVRQVALSWVEDRGAFLYFGFRGISQNCGSFGAEKLQKRTPSSWSLQAVVVVAVSAL